MASKSKVPHGLDNLGNTCFLNSVLQFFLSSSIVESQVINHTCESTKCLNCALKNLIVSKSKESLNVLYSNFTSKERRFSGYGQQDSLDFILSFLDNFTPSISKPFESKLSMKFSCTKCDHLYKKKDFLLSYSLALSKNPKENTITHLMSQYFSKEKFKPEDECEKCGSKSTRYKKFTLKRSPEILLVHLKLFSVVNGRLIKLNDKVSFTEHFTFGKRSYKLIGVVNHYGTLNFGHYTSYIRSEDLWYKCNDNSISIVDRRSVLDSTPYILFYEYE